MFSNISNKTYYLQITIFESVTLKIQAEFDTDLYPKGIQVTNKELEKVQIKKADFHGEWN